MEQRDRNSAALFPNHPSQMHDRSPLSLVALHLVVYQSIGSPIFCTSHTANSIQLKGGGKRKEIRAWKTEAAC